MLANSSLPHSPDPIKMQSKRDSQYNVPEMTVFGICRISPSIPRISVQHTKQSSVSIVNLEKAVSHGLSKKISNSIFLDVYKLHFLESFKLFPRKREKNS